MWKADKKKYVKRSSYAAYVLHLNKHLLPYFGSRTDIEAKDIQQYADDRLSSGLGLKTIKDSMLVLRMILRCGERIGAWEHVEFRVRFPTVTEKRKEFPVLQVAQQKRLAEYLLENFSFRNLGLLICLYSGIRIGEACALQWNDLDIGTHEIHIWKTISRVWISDGEDREYTLSVGSPKTASSIRDIPMAKTLAGIIRPLKKIVKPDNYVISNDSKPLEPRYFRDYYRKLLVRLGIPPVRFHALRHSFATRCIESRCDYKTVSVILGHSSLHTTLDLYVHPGFSEKKMCVEKMARVLTGR